MLFCGSPIIQQRKMLIFFLVWFVTHSEQNGLQQLVHSFVHVGRLTFIITSEAKKKKEKKNF